jgi:tetratricopeptide (TPR) repeat protein
VYTLSGAIFRSIEIPMSDGTICSIASKNSTFAFLTSKGILRTYSLKQSSLESGPVLLAVTSLGSNLMTDFVSEEAIEMSINTSGTLISIFQQKVHQKFILYEVSSGSSVNVSAVPKDESESHKCRLLHFYWDQRSEHLFLIETIQAASTKVLKYLSNNNNGSSSNNVTISLSLYRYDAIDELREISPSSSSSTLLGLVTTPKETDVSSRVILLEEFNVQSSSVVRKENVAFVSPFVVSLSFDLLGKPHTWYDTPSMYMFSDLRSMAYKDPAVMDALLNFQTCVVLQVPWMVKECIIKLPVAIQPTVWEGIIRTSFLARRLDILCLCLVAIEHSRGLALLRKFQFFSHESSSMLPKIASNIDFHDQKVQLSLAEVAICLGMYNEAESIYLQSMQYRSLVELYMNQGKWNNALEVVAKYGDLCEISAKEIILTRAKYHETLGDVISAMESYELANEATYNIPRMLMERDDIPAIHAYCAQHPKDKVLQRWYCQFLEHNPLPSVLPPRSIMDGDQPLMEDTNGTDIDAGMKHSSSFSSFSSQQPYDNEKEFVQTVSKYLQDGKPDQALNYLKTSKSKSLSAHLMVAAYYQDHGFINEAIRIYLDWNCESNAFSVVSENPSKSNFHYVGLNSKIPSIQLQCCIQLLVSFNAVSAVIEIFRLINDPLLTFPTFFRYANTKKEVDLFIQDLLTNDQTLIETVEKSMWLYCIDILLSREFYKQACILYTWIHEYEKAIQLIQMHSILLSDEFVELLSPMKKSLNITKLQREKILLQVSQLCEVQGLFVLAAKKYTQAGSKLAALRALFKSRDYEKVIFFVNVCKLPNLYKEAADWLREFSLKPKEPFLWHSDMNLIQTILDFYTFSNQLKSKFEFYQEYAYLEANQFRNYKSSYDILERMKPLIESEVSNSDTVLKTELLELVQTKLNMLQLFFDAEQNITIDGKKMIQICENMLNSMVRIKLTGIHEGDIRALFVHYYIHVKDLEKAYVQIKAISSCKDALQLNCYLPKDTIALVMKYSQL